MSEPYERAQRAWEARPGDPDAALALIRAARRSGRELPRALDPRWLVSDLVEALNETYPLMDAAGYDHRGAGAVLDIGPPFDVEAIRAAITALAEESEETANGESNWLPYPCLGVRDIRPAATLGFTHVGFEPERLPEPFRAPFAKLAALTERALAPFADAQVFSVNADYPNNGQVYWDITSLLYLPCHEQSLLFVVQHYW